MEKQANMAAQDTALDSGFLDAYSGEGLETIDSKARSTPYLTLLQPSSELVGSGSEAGTWRDSSSGKNFGTEVRVVPVQFKVLWTEREAAPPYATVGRYEPNSIEVTKQQAQGRKFPRMVNPVTGNEVKETYIYALTLPDHPEVGVVLFEPSLVSMKVCRKWNTMLTQQILSNGKPAPIFAYSWILKAELVPNPQNKALQLAAISGVEKSSMIEQPFFERFVKPQIAGMREQLALLASPDTEEAYAEE